VLDGLDAIDWSALAHAYGPATDVPALLRAVAAGDEASRRAALGALFGNVWHQGTVYEATAAAVPFLVELAARTGAPDRDVVLALVGCIARGQSYHAVHAPSRRERVARETAWVRAAHAAVRAEAATLVALLRDEDPGVRAAAAHALAALPEEAERSRPALRAAVAAAGDPRERAAHGLALAVLGELVVAAFRGAPGAALPLGRLEALAAVTAGGAFPPENVLELLLDLAQGGDVDGDRLDDLGAP
jgi:hypothetical protein